MFGPSLKSDTHVFLPIGFIFFALLAFGTSQAILLFNTDKVLLGEFRTPILWMVAHFLLLGFAVMVAMGVMYYLVPAVFATSIFSETLGFIQQAITIIGFLSFSLLLGLRPDQAIYGGIIVVIGIFLFLIQMFLTIRKQKDNPIVKSFVIGALICFLLTIVAGVILTWSLAFENVQIYQAVFKSHITPGVAGWFSLLIFGFSYNLVPMFTLSRGFSKKYAKFVFAIYITGLLLLNVSFWLAVSIVQTIGWLLLLIGFVFFSIDVQEILQKRLRRKLDQSLSFALLAIVVGLTIHGIALFLSIFNITDQRGWGWLIFLYVLGWIIFSILGYLQKIVPFILLAHQSTKSNESGKIPSITEMIDEKLNTILFSLFLIGIIGVIFGVIVQMGSVILISQFIFTVTTLIYIYSIVKMTL